MKPFNGIPAIGPCEALEPIMAVSLRVRMAAGTEIGKAARAAWLLCLHADVPVSFKFNDTELTIYPEQPSEDVVRIFHSKRADMELQ